MLKCVSNIIIIFVLFSSFTPNAVEDEKGHLRSQSDIEFRQTAECTKPCVAWNTELRAFLTSKANSSFLSSLSTCSMWPLEVVRVLNIVGKGKAKDEINLSYNGVCYADLSTLLYPGIHVAKCHIHTHIYYRLSLTF